MLNSSGRKENKKWLAKDIKGWKSTLKTSNLQKIFTLKHIKINSIRLSALQTVGISLYKLDFAIYLPASLPWRQLKLCCEGVCQIFLLWVFYGPLVTHIYLPFPEPETPICICEWDQMTSSSTFQTEFYSGFFLAVLSLLHWGMQKMLVKKSTNIPLAWKTRHAIN